MSPLRLYLCGRLCIYNIFSSKVNLLKLRLIKVLHVKYILVDRAIKKYRTLFPSVGLVALIWP